MRTVRLGDLCEIKSGGTPRRGVGAYYGGPIPWAKIGDLDGADPVLSATEETLTTEGLRAIRGRLFPAGTILLAMYGSVGKLAVAGVELATNQAILGIQVRDKRELDPGFLRRWLESIQLQLVHDARGVTQQNISAAHVRQMLVPLPTLIEQRRIARLLDTIDDVQSQFSTSISVLEKLVRSAFLRLFGDPFANERQWPMVRLADLVSDVQYGTSAKANSDGRGLPVLRMNNLTTSGEIELTDLKWCEIAERDIPKYSVRPGDLLFNRTNSPKLVGKAAVWQEVGTFAFAGYLVRVRFVESCVSPHFVSACLNSASGKHVLFSKAKASNNMSNISASELMRISIPVPPLGLQHEFDRIRIAVARVTQQARHAALQARNLMGALVQRELQHRAIDE